MRDSGLHRIDGCYQRLDEDLILARQRFGEILDIVECPAYFFNLDSLHLDLVLDAKDATVKRNSGRNANVVSVYGRVS